jgi:hypothetical protein
MLHGFFGPEKEEWFEYSAGVFNGNGRNKTNNDNPEMMESAALLDADGPVQVQRVRH